MILLFLLSAEARTDLFARVYGGSEDDWPYSLVPCSDGGFALAGHTRGFGSEGANILVAKLGFAGEPEWAITLGGPSSEYGNSIIQTPEEGFVISGTTRSFGAGGSDAIVIKMRQDGEIEWVRVIGGTGNECVYSLIQLPDGEIVCAGYTTSFGEGGSDILVFTLSEDGELIWAKAIGAGGSESATSLLRTDEGGFLAVGYRGNEPLVLCLGAGGEIIWARLLGLEGGYIRTAISYPDGYILAGWMKGANGYTDAVVVKLDQKGNPRWARSLGGKGQDWASSLFSLPSGGFGLAGSISLGHYNFLIAKLSYAGEAEWTRTFGSPGWDAAMCATLSTNGRIVVAGYTSGFGIGGDDILILVLGPEGDYPGCAVDCPITLAALRLSSGGVSAESRPCYPEIAAPEVNPRRISMGVIDVCAEPVPDKSTDE